MKLGGLVWLLILFVGLLPAAGTALADSSQAEEPADMVLMPAGEFLMGSPEGKGRKDEYPQHKVYLDAYWIDRYEVTGGDFEKYLAQNPKQHPTITGWYDRKARPGDGAQASDRPHLETVPELLLMAWQATPH